MRSDSSISNPPELSTSPSTGSWSPGRRAITSSITMLLSSYSDTFPDLRSLTRGAATNSSRSRVRLARSSWMIPMAEFVMSTMPNRASRGCCNTTSTTKSKAPSRMLKRVTTLERMISLVVRLGRSGTVLTKPARIRCWTSCELRPDSAGSVPSAVIRSQLTGISVDAHRGKLSSVGR